MSTRETILAAVQTILVNASVAAGRVYRARREQIETLPAVEIDMVSAASQSSAPLGVADHSLVFAVAALAKGDTPETAVDATLAAAHAALLAAGPTLGLGADVQLLPEWEAESPDIEQFDYVRLAHRYTVLYRTASGAF